MGGLAAGAISPRQVNQYRTRAEAPERDVMAAEWMPMWLLRQLLDLLELNVDGSLNNQPFCTNPATTDNLLLSLAPTVRRFLKFEVAFLWARGGRH